MSRSPLYALYGAMVLCLATLTAATPPMAQAQDTSGQDLPPEEVERLRNEKPLQLDQDGNPIPEDDLAGEFVPDEVIVRFRPGTLALPQGQTQAALGRVGAPSAVSQVMQAVGARELRKVFPSFTPADTVRTLRSGERVQVEDLSQTFVLKFPAPVDVPAVIEALEKLPQVLYAEPNHIYTIESVEMARRRHALSLFEDPDAFLSPVMLATPSDPRFSQQWALKPTSNNGINAQTAWDIQKGSYNVRLGIFDSGIDYTHPDLGGALGAGKKVAGGHEYFDNDTDPRDDLYHGTHVAGIAGALTNNINSSGNREGIAGVAGGWSYDARNGSGNKGAQLYAMKVGGTAGVNATVAAQAILEGADPNQYDLDVLNNSWGGPNRNDAVRSAVNYAARMKRVFVAATGNDDLNARRYPAAFDADWVIAVGATAQDGRRATYQDWGYDQNGDPLGSNYGDWIDVVAPGTAILSTMPTYTTATMNAFNWPTHYAGTGASGTGLPISGTSMAAPHVSGLAALLLAQRSTLHPQDVQGIIRASAKDTGPTGYDIEQGAGLINAGLALQMLRSPWALDQYTTTGGAIASSTGTYTMTINNTGGGLSSGIYIVKRHEVRKGVPFSKAYTAKPYVWGRGASASTGWGAESPNYQTGYAQVVASSNTTVTLRTFVYQVWTESGNYLGWYPTSASNVRFAYTVLGRPSTATTLPPPANLRITNAGTPDALPQLAWNAVSGASEYRIYRQCDGPTCSGFVLVRTTPSTTWTDGDVIMGSEEHTYDYHVRAANASLVSAPSNVVSTDGRPATRQDVATAAQGGALEAIPTAYALEANYPNPFNPTTEIRYALPEAADVRLTVYDGLGREVARLVDGPLGAGHQRATFDAGSLPSGLYLYRLEAKGAAEAFSKTGRMMLVK